LVKKCRKEAEEKDRVEKECATKQHAKQEEFHSKHSGKSRSPQTEEKEQSKQGNGGQEEQRTPFQMKRYKD